MNQWSGEEGNWVKQDHPFSFEINSKILEKKTVLYEQIKRNYNANKNITIDSLLHHLEKKGNRHSFFDYMENYVKRPPEKLEENTIKKYRTTLNHPQAFKKQIYFSDIDNDFLRDFLRYLQVDLRLGGAAARKYMEALKKVIRKARKENLIDSSQMEFLFDDVKIKVPKAKKIFLEPHEIKALKDLTFLE
ncbi:MAG: phage integrase SAM-like domain-containing protein [Chitinophagaceae bacterium]|nr:phage integrase SAM-like domain-containing protein [Chitinophagaceae bacterium]